MAKRATTPAETPAAAAGQQANLPARQDAPAGAAGASGGAGAGGAIVKRGPAGLNVADASSFALIQIESGDDQESKDLQEAMLANLGDGQALSPFDFDRIRVPAGGGQFWEILDAATGETKPANEFIGIISSWNDQKAFWKVDLDDAENGGKTPPDCFSTDCVKGQGDPGIECARCPNNAFGTAKGGKGKGKACKDTRLLFVMREAGLMPDLVIVPPTSLKAVKKYFQFLMSRGVPYYRAVTRFKLAKDKNEQGREFSRIEPTLVGVLPAEQFAISRKFSTHVGKMLGKKQVSISAADLRGGDQVTEPREIPETVEGEAGNGGGNVSEPGEGSGDPAGVGGGGDQFDNRI